MRPAACRRARSSLSCSSLSSKSSRSSVAACSISRRLVALLNRSDSSESSSDTARPSTSETTASAELEREQPQRCDRASRSRAIAARSSVAVRRCDEQHHLVDDQLADVERRDGQQRANEAQHRLRERQRRAGLPDQPQERRHVAQAAKALAKRTSLGMGDAVGRGRLGRAGAHRIVAGHAAIVPRVRAPDR